MKKFISYFFVGFIFSIGLSASGMTDPQKIIGFLDVFGNWDPSLLFVMVGAIGVHFFTFKLISKRKSPLLDTHWHLPIKKSINFNLIFGSIIFGIGWGLAGYCPGPSIVSLSLFELNPFMFVISMLGGMIVYRLFSHLKTQ